MSLGLSCCGPCNDIGFCKTDVNCCIECHMSWEESHAGPYLPPELMQRLRLEHFQLAQAKFPHDALARHSVWEEQIFKQYCPADVCAQIHKDHIEWEHGHLRSRETRR